MFEIIAVQFILKNETETKGKRNKQAYKKEFEIM